jgi:hypothetical protein
MSWCDNALNELKAGREVFVQFKGDWMEPDVPDGARVLLASIADPYYLKVGDIVLAPLNGKIYLHKILATEINRVKIGDIKGSVSGFVGRVGIYGRAILIYPPEKTNVSGSQSVGKT